LRRTTGDAKVLGGVAAGIARSLGIDPILVRVAFVVLTIFGGSGVVLYLAGWLFIPEDGRPDSAGERFFRDHNALAIAAAVVVGIFIVGPMLAWGVWGDGPGFGGIVLLFLVVAGVIALTRRSGPPAQHLSPTSAAAAAPVSDAVAAPGATTPGPAGTPAGPGAPTLALPMAPPAPPPAPKEKSVLGRLTFGLTVLVAGTLIALDLGGAISVTAVTVLATSLGIVAVGLLIGAFVGRSRWLIALGVLLTLVLIPTAAVPTDVRWNAGAGAGDRTYRVTSQEDLSSTYELGVGALTLDLRRLDLTERVAVDASLGIGELTVLLPPDVTVTTTADVAVGTIDLPGEQPLDGVSVDRTWERPASEATTTGSLDLTLSTGLGQVTVIDDNLEVTR
jgi:phage shock protein PspC (stress-responsive transcriptional regulator)